jgi:hypothetical protein
VIERAPEGIDVDWHGDVYLVPDRGDHQELVARFTDGALQWVRPVDRAERVILDQRKRDLCAQFAKPD